MTATKRKRVKEIYVDRDLGIVFVADDNTEHYYRYHTSLHGVEYVTIEQLPPQGKGKRG